jgi:chorismate mutase
MENRLAPFTLEHIRHEIDEIDRAMLELLERRFQAIEEIKKIKGHDAARAASPMRPAREAEILKRLHRLRQAQLPVDLMVRLWRCIIAEATQAQALVRVHVEDELMVNPYLRDMVRDHYPGLPMAAQRDASRLVEELAKNGADVGVVPINSDWVEPLVKKGVKVIGMLPFIAPRNLPPQILILGHAKAETTGDDETLLICGGEGRPSKYLWEVKAGNYSCVSIEGFLYEKSEQAVLLERVMPGMKIVGHCPCPIEATV